MKCPPSTCFVCRLAGLRDCPGRGARLPLAEAEQPSIKNRAFSASVRPSGGDGASLYSNGLTEAERQRIYQFLKDRGSLE